MSRSNNHWEGLEPNPDCFFGFIYLIENTVNGRLYVGKKQYWAATGNFRNRSSHISTDKWRPEQWKPSDWNYYTGSSKELNADIKKFGKDKFRFIILSQHSTKGDLHYEEIKEQAVRNVLAEKLTEDVYLYYNKSIAAIKFRPPDHVSDSTREKLSLLNRGKTFTKETREKLSLANSGEKNHQFGKPLSETTKKKISLSLSGEKHPRFGKPLSETVKEKISLAKRGEKHPQFGKPISEATKKKMSLANKGQKRSQETRKKISLGKRKTLLARTIFSSLEELEVAVIKSYEKTKSMNKTAKEIKISPTAVWNIIQKHKKDTI